MSWITAPKRRKVQLKTSPRIFQLRPNKPSKTSNHCSQPSPAHRSRVTKQQEGAFTPKNTIVVIRQLQVSLGLASTHLNDMILEDDPLPLLPSPILNIEPSDHVTRPAADDAVEKLERYPRGVSELGERIW